MSFPTLLSFLVAIAAIIKITSIRNVAIITGGEKQKRVVCLFLSITTLLYEVTSLITS